MSLVITGLAKFTQYSTTVKAFNNIGTGPKNVPEVVASTDEDGENIKGYMLNLTSVSSPQCSSRLSLLC